MPSFQFCISSLVSAFLVLSAPLSVATAETRETERSGFSFKVAPFLEQHCVACHSGDEPEGGLALDRLDQNLAASAGVARQWQKVVEKLILGEMPPKDEARPKQEELDGVIEAVNAELQRSIKILRSKGGNEIVYRRLNKRQFNHTIHDLFGLEGDFAASFPDDAVKHGFDNIGSELVLSASQLEAYMAAADVILEKAIVSGNRPKTTSTSFSLTTLDEVRKPRRPFWQHHKGDRVIVMRYGHPQLHNKFTAPVEGYYRLRVTAYAIRNKGRRLRVEVQHGRLRNRAVLPTLDGQFEVFDERPRTFEFTALLKRRDTFALFPAELTNWMQGPEITGHDGPGVVIRKIDIEGPLVEVWPPKSHRVIFADVIKDEYSDDEVARILKRFASKAFRRPAPQSELDAYFSLYQQARRDGDDCLPALNHCLKAVLCSPLFLHLHEEPGELDDYALASRLSYFLWLSAPDDELLQLAARKQLAQPQTLRRQIARMIADPKADRFINDFVGQWLGVNKVGEMRPDPRLYPEYDAYLERSMRDETRSFFREVLRKNLSIDTFIKSDFAMLNGRLASHYGIADVEGVELRRVSLPPNSHRGGLLTQASILMVTSNGTTTSPVVRGVWMLENILGQPTPPPPPVSTDIEPDIRGATTIKEQLAKHRTIAQCNVCHRKIDPFGLALENFDVVGGWREHYRKIKPGARPSRQPRFDQYIQGAKVESFGKAANFGQFEDFESFRTVLMKNNDLVATCVAEKLMMYALGRELDIADDETIDSIVEHLEKHDRGLATLVEQIVLSRAFLTN